MGEGIASALAEGFEIMTSGIASYGKGFAGGLAETAKNAFFEVSTEGVITGLNAFGALTFFSMAVGLAIGACQLVFNLF